MGKPNICRMLSQAGKDMDKPPREFGNKQRQQYSSGSKWCNKDGLNDTMA